MQTLTAVEGTGESRVWGVLALGGEFSIVGSVLTPLVKLVPLSTKNVSGVGVRTVPYISVPDGLFLHSNWPCLFQPFFSSH